MKDYVKLEIFLSKNLIEEIHKVVEYRNVKSLIYTPTNKERSVEEFVKGATVHQVRNMQKQNRLSGIEELTKPFSIKNKFKEFADFKNITQKMVSEATGIALSNINNIWNNKTQPSLDYFLRLWFVLGCPPFEKILYREEA